MRSCACTDLLQVPIECVGMKWCGNCSLNSMESGSCSRNSTESGSCEASWSSWHEMGLMIQGLKGSDVWMDLGSSLGFGNGVQVSMIAWEETINCGPWMSSHVGGWKEGRKEAQGWHAVVLYVGCLSRDLSDKFSCEISRKSEIHISKSEIRVCKLSYDRGKSAVSCRWTSWVWEITGWSWRLKTSGELWIVWEESIEEYIPI
jgi:hypothetical protein